jgi:molybdopterin-guanine dinucleotide biosynthesis protein A
MLSIVVQAGGESQRMGQDKALIPFLGEPLIQRVINRISYLADELLVTTNYHDDYRFLGVPLFSDEVRGQGALGGLYTALKAARYPLVGVVACDMPFVCPDLLAAEFKCLKEENWDAVVPSTGNGEEPFHAVYRRETCLPAIQTSLEQKELRVNSWYSRVRIHFLAVEEIQKYDPELLAFWNLNTPGELIEAEKVAVRLQ